MSIRRARANGLWETAFSRRYLNRYEKLEFRNLFCLEDGDVKFHGGISAIVGGNGVGKSTLAAALGELLTSERTERYIGERYRLAGSALKGFLSEGNLERTREASNGLEGTRNFLGDAIGTESWWLDPAYWAFLTRKQILDDQNFEDVIEPLTPLELDGKALETLAYVVGKQYQSCRIFEVADYAGLDRFPYFKVQTNEIEYGSEGMGQGELALLVVLWVLQDLRSNSILILEEPESHVSPRSQAALMDVLAEAAATKGIWTIITTHSPTIVQRIPPEHLRLLIRNQSRTEIVENVRRHQVASLLGGVVALNGVVLVEDDVAKELTIAVLDEFSPDLLRQLEVLKTDGEAKISASLRNFPKGAQFRLIGVFDGDQRALLKPDDFNWPHVFLPGNVDPANLLKAALEAPGAIDRLVSELRRDRNSLVSVLDALSGTEARDWIIEIVKALVVTKAELIRALFRVWITNQGAREDADNFVDALTEKYNSC